MVLLEIGYKCNWKGTSIDVLNHMFLQINKFKCSPGGGTHIGKGYGDVPRS